MLCYFSQIFNSKFPPESYLCNPLSMTKSIKVLGKIYQVSKYWAEISLMWSAEKFDSVVFKWAQG